MRRDALVSLALLAAGWALTLWVAPWSDDSVNDLFVYRAFAEPLLDGWLPYRDIAFEYPPLAAPVIALPAALGTGDESFRWAFALWTLAGGVGVVLLCGALARATGGNPRRAMLAAALMPILLGALVRTHFDLFPLALLLGGLLLLCRDRPRAGMTVLGLGAMTKLFPLVAVPVALVWLVARGHRREAWQSALACAATLAVVAGAALAVSPDGAADAVRYQLDRPVQIESSPAMLLLGLDAAGVGDAESVSSHRSDGLLHDASGAVSALLAGVMVGLVVLLASRVGRTRRELVLASLAATLAFALFGKVLSPQFMIWVLPLGALAFAWRRYALAAAVALAAILTQVEFPAHYADVVAREPLALVLVAVRNGALLAALVLAMRELQPGRHEQLLDSRRAALAVRLD
jgi:Glycosyltransferase family 87